MKKAVKQVAQIPFEILKEAPKQILGIEDNQDQQKPIEQSAQIKKPQAPSTEEKNKPRILTALEQEMNEIRKDKERQLQEQRQIEETQKRQVEMQKAGGTRALNIPSKKGRRLGGWGQKLKDLASRNETRKPSSG